MTPRQIWIHALFALAVVLTPVGASAQDPWAGRVQDALEITDRRIELAETLVSAGAPAQAAAELSLAREQQNRAYSAFNAAQYGLAGRATLEARAHADRAIAIVRGLPDPERVQVQVERTAELLERARDRMADCPETRAKSLLRVGQEMQLRAEAAVAQSRYLAALQLTMSARERVLKAMRLCNVSESLGENATRALRRTDDLLARTRERLGDGGPPEARGALERAQSLQAEAQAEFRAQHFEASLRLTHTARLAAQRVVRPGPGPPARRGKR